MSDLIKPPEEREYNLVCKAKTFTKAVVENHAKYTSQIALLVPEDNDERTRFLNAWLPDEDGQHYEIAAYIPPPIDSPVRLSVHRGPDENNNRHYLFVMTTGVAKRIAAANRNGEFRATIKILPESEIEAADNARDDDQGNYDVVGQ